jgi:trimethylamine--corrinoid protein Co-methyltransferase
VTPETLAIGLVEEVGPAGHFLEKDHTHRFFKREQWRPDLMTRVGLDEWRSLGAKDTATRIQEKLKMILEEHQAPALPDKVLAALDRIKRQGEEELTSK